MLKCIVSCQTGQNSLGVSRPLLFEQRWAVLDFWGWIRLRVKLNTALALENTEVCWFKSRGWGDF